MQSFMDLAARKNTESRQSEKTGEAIWLQGLNQGVG
jgi:hypothetical protein